MDQYSLMRYGEACLLENEVDLEVVGQARTAEEGFALLERLHPDVALVDVNLPGMNGLTFARQVTALYPDVRLLVVSPYDDSAYLTEALDVGVSGYLLRTASGSEFVDAVRAVADGVFVLDRSLSGYLTQHRRGASIGPKALSPREAAVLSLLARGLTNKRIADELGLRVGTVDSHVSNILAKFGVASRTGAAAYALTHHLIASSESGGALSGDRRHGGDRRPPRSP